MANFSGCREFNLDSASGQGENDPWSPLRTAALPEIFPNVPAN